MEAFRALISGALAPAGNPIVTRGLAGDGFVTIADFQAHFYDSGTSALAVALKSARDRRSEVISPKVIIPGYCCPDLVSAARFAGLRPVAVDINCGDASYDLRQLAQAVDADTVAVIAVNFLGIAERLGGIRELLEGRNVVLVEDNAQWLPSNEYKSIADYVVFSFGRGKPLSLLGGGVLFSRVEAPALYADVNPPDSGGISYRLKLLAYNWMLRPLGYGLVSQLKFLRLGRTVYKPKSAIAHMDCQRKKLLAVNFFAYQGRSGKPEKEIAQFFLAMNHLPYQPLGTDRRGRLLRFPVLCQSKEARDLLFTQLSGLGVSALYASPIDCVEGVSGLVDIPRPLVNAQDFADRLLTLPLHEYVRGSYLHRILQGLAHF